MELRAGYKQTEVGMIPEDWVMSTLGNNCSFENGDRSSNYPSPGSFQATGIPFINAGHISDGKISANEMDYINQASYDKLGGGKVKSGDMLFCLRGSIGKFGLVGNSFGPGAIASSLVIVRSKERLLSRDYLRCYFGSKLCAQMIETWAGGAAQPNLGAAELAKFLVPLPPLYEQRAIATALSDVDALLAKIDQLISKKRDLKQAVMQQLLTGQTRLPGFIGAWEVKRLGDLFAFSGGHTASREQLSNSGYCYLHYGDIHKSTKTYIDLEAEFLDIPKLTVRLSDVTPSAMLKDGDVVFVDASEDDEGTSRHVVVVNPLEKPYISGLHTIVAKAKGDLLDNGFKRFCFQTKIIKQQFQFFAVGTKVSGISKTSIAKIELTFPPKAEQTAIASVLSDMDAELAALEARRDKTRALKQGMMQALLTGRIRLIRVN